MEKNLIPKIISLYEQISTLDSLKPSKDVDTLFTDLVLTCMPPSPIDVTKLNQDLQEMRSRLIRLCGEAEGHLESHFSTILGSYKNPIDHLGIFPYYNNYVKLGLLEFNLLKQQLANDPRGVVPDKVAFVGSGPLPLTSIVLASEHLTESAFHNYDVDQSANAMASKLLASHPDLSKRMFFHTTNIMDVTDDLKQFDVVFLAALVGMDKEAKLKVVQHLAKYMAPGSILMVRSAHGARAFLYPVIDPCDLKGFQVLSVYHPTDEVINSVVVARKCPVQQQFCFGLNISGPSKMMPYNCTCASFRAFNPPMLEELAIED